MSTIAVTGATGNIGGAVARLLAEAGRAQRLLVRTPGKAPTLPEAEVAAFDYDDPDTARTALDGVDVLFLVSAPESDHRLAQHRDLIDAAVAAGVEHVVYTSFQGAAPDATFTLAREHHATEEHIKASGMQWTILRDSFYIDFLESLVGDDGVIRGPAGDGHVAAVARRDVARVAATVLQAADRHRGSTYDLTGPEALTLEDVARTLSEETGRPVRFHDETDDEAYASRRRWPAPDWQYDAWVSTYTAIRAGELAARSTAVEDLTGVPPTTFAAFLRAGSRSM